MFLLNLSSCERLALESRLTYFRRVYTCVICVSKFGNCVKEQMAVHQSKDCRPITISIGMIYCPNSWLLDRKSCTTFSPQMAIRIQKWFFNIFFLLHWIALSTTHWILQIICHFLSLPQPNQRNQKLSPSLRKHGLKATTKKLNKRQIYTISYKTKSIKSSINNSK